MPRSVCPRQKFHCCQIASGSPHESSEIVPQQLGSHAQQDSMMNCASVSSRISPDLPPCFHFACQSHRCRFSVTPQPYVLVKETLNEFEESSGRIVRGLLHQNRNDFHERQVSVNKQRESWHISVLFLHWQTLSSRMRSQMLRRCGSSFPRPMTHSSHHRAGR